MYVVLCGFVYNIHIDIYVVVLGVDWEQCCHVIWKKPVRNPLTKKTRWIIKICKKLDLQIYNLENMYEFKLAFAV